MTMMLISGGDLDEEGAAAAIAAVTCLLEEEAAAAADALQPELVQEGWRAAARMMAQGMAPARLPAGPRWGSIERLRRASRGGRGIIGQ